MQHALISEVQDNDTKAWFNVQMQDIYGASGYFLEKDSVKKEKHL